MLFLIGIKERSQDQAAKAPGVPVAAMWRLCRERERLRHYLNGSVDRRNAWLGRVK